MAMRSIQELFEHELKDIYGQSLSEEEAAPGTLKLLASEYDVAEVQSA